MSTYRENPAVKGGSETLHSPKVSAAGLAVCLKGIDFPADKNKIMEHARSVNCSENVLDYINKLPEREYTRANEVEQEFGKLK